MWRTFHLMIVFFCKKEYETRSNKTDIRSRVNIHLFLVLSCSTGQYFSTFLIYESLISLFHYIYKLSIKRKCVKWKFHLKFVVYKYVLIRNTPPKCVPTSLLVEWKARRTQKKRKITVLNFVSFQSWFLFFKGFRMKILKIKKNKK